MPKKTLKRNGKGRTTRVVEAKPKKGRTAHASQTPTGDVVVDYHGMSDVKLVETVIHEGRDLHHGPEDVPELEAEVQARAQANGETWANRFDQALDDEDASEMGPVL